MEIEGIGPIFLCACFGSILIEVLKWYQIKDSPNLPIYATSPFYWSVSAVMVLCSGALAILYGVTPRSAIMVLNIGGSAPLIIKSLADMKSQEASSSRVATKPPRTNAGRKAKSPVPPNAPGYKQEGTDPRDSQHESASSISKLFDFLAWR